MIGVTPLRCCLGQNPQFGWPKLGGGVGIDVTEQVATEGGATVDGLADQLEKHPATIYRAIQNLGNVLELDQGDVSFRARKYREELRALVESAEYAIESYADRIQHLMGLADHIAWDDVDALISAARCILKRDDLTLEQR